MEVPFSALYTNVSCFQYCKLWQIISVVAIAFFQNVDISVLQINTTRFNQSPFGNFYYDKCNKIVNVEQFSSSVSGWRDYTVNRYTECFLYDV